MLYRHPGEHFLNGDYFDYIIVPESETESMLDCGWYLTTQDAKDAHDHQDDPPEVEVQPKRRGLKDLTEEEIELILCENYTTQDAKDAHDHQDDPPEVEVQPKRRGFKDLTEEEIDLISCENCSLLALVEKYNITYHTARKIKANELDKKTIH